MKWKFWEKSLKDRFQDELNQMSKDDVFELFEISRKALDTKQHDFNVEVTRQASGNVIDDRAIVGFLYLLMRDHVTPGRIESCVLQTANLMEKKTTDYVKYTNGWLAEYAKYVADRLEMNRKTTEKL